MDDEDVTLPSSDEENDAAMAPGDGEPTALSQGGLSDSGITFGGASKQPAGKISSTTELKLGGTIAQGGMGAILEASDEALDRTVAMKVMLPGADASEGARRRFVREAMVLARLEHPNIVPIHELGRDGNGRPFYTMKLVKGRTLQAIITEIAEGNEQTIADFPLNRLLTIFRQICDAMAFAHHRGVIHRDLKPENVMVGEFGETLVMDWGLAKILEDPQEQPFENSDEALAANDKVFGDLLASQLSDSVELTMDGAVMGSPKYMAPEQAAGKVNEIDARTDIYGLGGILYTILTLKAPVAGTAVNELLGKVMSGDIMSPTDLASAVLKADAVRSGAVRRSARKLQLPHCPGGNVPASLSAVAMMALAVKPADRYRSVGDLAQDVEAFQTGHATSVEDVSFLGQFVLLVKRNRGISIATAIGLTLLITVTTGFLVKVEAEKEAALKSEEDALAAKSDAEDKGEKLRATMTNLQVALTTSRLTLADQAYRQSDWARAKEILNEIPQAYRDADWTYQFARADTSITPLEARLTNVWRACAHPLMPGVFGISSQHGWLHLFDAPSSRPVFSIRNTGIYRHPAISPDGSLLAAASSSFDNDVRIYRLSDGRLLNTLPLTNIGVTSLSFDRKSRRVFVAGRQRMQAMDIRSGKTLWKMHNEPGIPVLNARGHPLLHAGIWIRMLDPRTGATIGELPRSSHPVRSLALSPDGKRVVYLDDSGFAHGVAIPGQKKLFETNLGDKKRTHLAFLPDGDRFALAASDKDRPDAVEVEVRDATNGRLIQRFTGATVQPFQQVCHPLSGELLLAGGGTIAWAPRYPPADFQSETSVRWPVIAGSAWVFLDDDRILMRTRNGGLAVGDLDGKSIVDARGLLPEDAADPQAIVDITPDRSHVLIDRQFSDKGRSGFLLARRSGERYESVSTHEKANVNALPAWLLRLSPSGDRAFIAEDFSTAIWDVGAWKKLADLRAKTHLFHVREAAWLPDGSAMIGIATHGAHRGKPGSREIIYLWDATDGKVLKSEPTTGLLESMAMEPGGDRIIEGGSGGRIRIRRAPTLEIERSILAHDESITALAWHPKRSIIASGSHDKAIRLWNPDNGRMLGEIYGLAFHPVQIRFSPGGEWLAASTSNGDSRLRAWDWERAMASESPTALTKRHFTLAETASRRGEWLRAKNLLKSIPDPDRDADWTNLFVAASASIADAWNVADSILTIDSGQPLRSHAGHKEISRDAEYRIVSIVGHPHPEHNAHARLLMGGATAAHDFVFHTTESHLQPHIVVRLKSPSDVRAVQIVNRKDKRFRARAAGLILRVSGNGQTWQQVWRANTVEAEWLVDLKTGVNARYLKLGLPDSGPLHLRELVVFGKRIADRTKTKEAAIQSEPTAQVALKPADLFGRYSVIPAENNWQSGVIRLVPGSQDHIEWKNDAGVSWKLTIESGNILDTGPGNPYRRQYPRFTVLTAPAKPLRIRGFVFQQGFYQRMDE